LVGGTEWRAGSGCQQVRPPDPTCPANAVKRAKWLMPEFEAGAAHFSCHGPHIVDAIVWQPSGPDSAPRSVAWLSDTIGQTWGQFDRPGSQ